MPPTAAGIPTGRYALPEEIAGAVLYLCSDLSGDVTGTHIVIDGGRSGFRGRGAGKTKLEEVNVMADLFEIMGTTRRCGG